MAMDVWLAEGATRDLMLHLIKEYHPHLALVEEQIAILFKEKASKSKGKVILGTAKKASTTMKALGKKDWVFIIEIGNDEWQKLSDEDRMARLDHLLCACGVEEKDDGTMRHHLIAPDASVYFANIERFGFHFDYDDEDEAAEKGATTIEDMFPSEEEEKVVEAAASKPKLKSKKANTASSEAAIDDLLGEE